MIRLLARVVGLVVLFVLILSGLRALGSSRATEGLLALDSGGCPNQPCWHGIRPGKTTFAQVTTILQSASLVVTGNISHSVEQYIDPYTGRPYMSAVYKTCWMTNTTPSWEGCAISWANGTPGTTIQSIVFTPPLNTFRLGDAVKLFGISIGRPYVCDNAVLRFTGRSVRYSGILSVTTGATGRYFDAPVLYPDMMVASITFVATDPAELQNSPYYFYWHGFGVYDGNCGIG